MTTTPRILIVDDEPDLLDAHESLLIPEGFTTDKALDGMQATEKLKTQAYDLVITDYTMPKMDGIQLLKWIKDNKIQTRTILLTGLATIDATGLALDLGCDAFLAKPIDIPELIRTIRSILLNTEEQNTVQYATISVQDFISGKNIPYSIYIRNKNKSFVKIAHTGEDLNLERIKSIRSRGIEELFIEKKDFDQYQILSLKLAQATSSKSAIPIKTRAQVIMHASEMAAQKLQLCGLSPEHLASASTVLDSALSVAADNSGVQNLMVLMSNRSYSRFGHASMTAMLGVMIAQIMDWNNKKNITALSLGCLFHDIGLFDMPEGLEFIPAFEMSDKQEKDYKAHPEKGAKLLSSMSDIPKEVITIVQQHHENGRDNGFPSRLGPSEIFPMAKMVRVLDLFSESLLKSNSVKKEPKQILKDLGKDPSTGFLDFSTTCALEALLNTTDLSAARRHYNSAIAEKHTIRS